MILKVLAAACSFLIPETLPVERLEVVMHFSDNSEQNEFQGPPELLKNVPNHSTPK
jgi:hypothetical protein